MIEAKGYKAFRGTMRINWDGKPHEEIYGDWIYTKDGPFGFWHYKEWSYPASVCEVVEVGGHWCWEGKFKACSKCGSHVEWNETLGANFWKFCPYCGTEMIKEGE